MKSKIFINSFLESPTDIRGEIEICINTRGRGGGH